MMSFKFTSAIVNAPTKTNLKLSQTKINPLLALTVMGEVGFVV